MCSPHSFWWPEPSDSAAQPQVGAQGELLQWCCSAHLRSHTVQRTLGGPGNSHSLQWSEQVILPLRGITLLSFCHADRFLFLCRQITSLFSGSQLCFSTLLCWAHTYLCLLSWPTSSGYAWLPWLSDILRSRHVRFLSPSCLLVKLHFLPFLFSPFSPIISSTLPGSCFHLILLLIFRFLCQTCLLFFKIFQYGKDTGTSQRQQKYWS